MVGQQAWRHVVRNLWHHIPANFEAEKEFNKWCSLVKPHCAVCMIFKPFAVMYFFLPPASIFFFFLILPAFILKLLIILLQDVTSRKDVQPVVPEKSDVEVPIAYYELLSFGADAVQPKMPKQLLVCSECNTCVHNCKLP